MRGRRLDLAIGIVLGLVLGAVIVAVFVFEFSEEAVDSPQLEQQQPAERPRGSR